MFEKVNPAHPDKVADRIAGAIVDLAYSKSDNPKIAVEVLLGHGRCWLTVESDIVLWNSQVADIVYRITGDERIRLGWKMVKQDAHLADNQRGAIRCGDNGIFKGCCPTKEQRVLTDIAGHIYERWPFDGKYMIAPMEDLVNIYRLTVCQSHAKIDDLLRLLEEFDEEMWYRKGEPSWLGEYTINPLGPWTGGPYVDSGATNRKLGSDMGDGITGGGLHGKDLSKADVSVNIWCYLEAVRTGKVVTACCSIGDETVNGVPYAEIVARAKEYIDSLGGFEKFAEWGLIRPEGLEK